MRRQLAAAGLGLMVAAGACSGEAVPTTAGATTTSAAGSTATTLVPPTSSTPPDDRRPVILDFSPTVSDIGALAFLASHPDLRLVAVTLPGTGESYCEPGVAHTRGVLVALGYPDIPVGCGPEEPTTGFNAFPTSWRVASNEMDLPEADPNDIRSAPDLMADLVRESDTPIEIVAVGPLTNLAVALGEDPELADLVAGVTIMGGAVDVAGNVFRNTVGEWNIWVDPTAAGVVFDSGVPVTLIPLDATNFLPSGRIFWDSLDAQATTPAATLVRDVWAANGDWIDNADGFFYFWDELAAAVLVNESLVTFEIRNLVVDDDTRDNKGWTREDPTGTPVRVALTADRLAFEQFFLDTLVGFPAELGYLEATPSEIAYFEAAAAITFDTDTAVQELLEQFSADVESTGDPDADFLLGLREALPSIVGGPLADQLARIEALDPPDSLLELHAAWVDELRRFTALEEDLVAALDDGFEALEALFAPLDEACMAVQAAADRRLLQFEVGCL